MSVAPVRRRSERISGCTTSYQRDGAGGPLLFLHGFEPFVTWEPFMERLATVADVIVPDHPGYGASEIPPWLDDIHDLAQFYREFIERLGLGRVDLVGHGIGGWIALELAVRNTASIRSLVLVDSPGLRVHGADGVDPFLCTAEQLRALSYADPVLAAEAGRPPDEAGFERNLKSGLTSARLAWQPRFHDPHLTKWLHLIDVPALVVWGADDRFFPAPHGTALAAAIPNARLAILPNCGHVPHLERPEAFAELVATFLAERAR